MSRVLYFIAILVLARTYQGCPEVSPLGVSNGFVKNRQISASSSIDIGDNYRPSQARLGIRNSWCGNSVGLSKFPNEWLQIDFERPVIIKAIATQGDPNNATNFVKEFFLEISDDGKVFNQINTTGGARKLFTGNTDNNGIKYNWIVNKFVSRYVRFRATKLNRMNDGSVCARVEFFGCNPGTGGKNAKYLYPLGMENLQIQNSQISASDRISGKDGHFARLNNPTGWCASLVPNTWLQVDLGKSFKIRGVSTQGSGERNSVNVVTSYWVAHSSNSSSGPFQNVEDLPGRTMVFRATPDTSQEPIFNEIPGAIFARYLRIIPKKIENNAVQFCMRIEVYGHQNCFRDMTSRPGNQITSSSLKAGNSNNALLHLQNTWCANVQDQNQFIKLTFGQPIMVNGIAIQGEANGANWVETFKVKYKTPCGSETEMTKVFTGSADSDTVSQHWFTSAIKMTYISINPKTWKNSICLRFQVIGCEADLKRIPLGMQNGYITSSQISAFTIYDNRTEYGPGQARLGIHSRWCGAKVPPDLEKDWHQVDFGRTIKLTGFAIQGDPTYAPNFVKKFYVEVGMTASSFADVQDCNGRKIFTANSDSTSIKYNYLNEGVIGRFVRFRAKEMNRANGDACFRIEYYGRELNNDYVQSKALFPLGMERKIIEDSQLTGSGAESGLGASEGRLNGVKGWCTGSKGNVLQISFSTPMTITAIAAQGHRDIDDMVHKYYVEYQRIGATIWTTVNDSSNAKKLFTANKETRNDPVMGFLDLPISTKKLGIKPETKGTGSSKYCMRVEIFGYASECSDDLTTSTNTLITASSYSQSNFPSLGHIYNPTSWCAESSDSDPYMLIDLGAIKTITGFGVQGDSNGDNWPKKTKVSFGNNQCCLSELAKTFIGSNDRNNVVYNWFSTNVIARFLKIKIHDKNGDACMRVQILGCDAEVKSRVPLGMSDGFIKDSQIKATSIHSQSGNSDSWLGSNARLKVTGSRWCSAKPLNLSDYLQVDLKTEVTLTGIATRGDDNAAVNYVKKFYLEISLNGIDYVTINGKHGSREEFIGNVNNNGIVYNWLPFPAKTRFVRFRATNVAGDQICARMEFYGSTHSSAADKALYSLGMESRVIEDSQLSSSSLQGSNPSNKGRLYMENSGWCTFLNNGNNQWLQIDFRQPMVVSAIATQGHGYLPSPDRVYKYYLQYREVRSATFVFVKNASAVNYLFTGNFKFQDVPVMNALPQIITTQYLRINPITAGDGSNNRCLRAEVYGYHPVCFGDLTGFAGIEASSSTETAINAVVYSPISWCASASDSAKYIDIDLNRPRMVTGIGIQGDSNDDQWVKTFKLSHALKKGDFTELTKTYKGNKDRNSVVRNWLLPPVFAQYLRIKVATFQSKSCMRIQILGCAKDHAILKSFKATVVNMRKVEVSWGIVYDASSPFTLQYRKESEKQWTEIPNLRGNETVVENLEKYENYIMRLKSGKGILMLKNYVFGGKYSETSRFNMRISPQIAPSKFFTTNVSSEFLSIHLQRLTQNEIADWDVKGINIFYQCNTLAPANNCTGIYPMEQNFTDVSKDAFLFQNLKPFTNYTLKITFFNQVSKGLVLITTCETVLAPHDPPEVDRVQVDASRLEIFMKKYATGVGKLARYEVSLRCVQTDRTRDCFIKTWKNLTALDISKPIQVNDLFSWTKYEIHIRIYNFAAKSQWKVISATTKETAPSASPTNVKANSKNATSMDISWTGLNKNDTNGIIVRYSIVVKRLETAKTLMVNVSNGTFKVIANGLKPYANYSVRIAAVNNAGDGPFSQTIIKETQEGEPAASPTIGSINPGKFSASIPISKNIDEEEENGLLLGYKIEYNCVETSKTRNCSKKDPMMVTTLGRRLKSLQLSSLMSWTNYTVRTRVFNKAGEGPWSQSKTFVTLEEAPSKPPRAITLDVTGSRSLQLKWQSPNWNDTNGIITQYSIGIRKQNVVVKVVNVSAADKSYNILNLKPYSNYDVEIAAINGAGLGPFSNQIQAQTAEEAPGDAPSITQLSAGKHNISLSIKNIDKHLEYGEILGYYVTYECVGNGADSRDCPQNSRKNITFSGYPKSKLSISNLMSWTKYSLKVQIFNSAGVSKTSLAKETITNEDIPSAAPGDVVVAVQSSTAIRISWKQLLKNDTNGPITGYEIILKYTRRGKPAIMNLETTEVSKVLTNLFPYTFYNVSLAAKNAAGLGPMSGVISKRTNEDAPSAPRIVSAVAQSSTSLKVRWNPPIDPNGVIRNYELEYCQGNCTVKSLPGSMSETTLENLVTNVNYTFKIRARTVKPGNWSAIVLGTTTEGIPIQRKIDIASRTATSIQLSWKEPEQPKGRIRYFTITGYGKRSYDSSFNQAINITYQCKIACESTYTIDKLVPGTSYTFQIAAATSMGLGPRSAPVVGFTYVSAAPKPSFDVTTIMKAGGLETTIVVHKVSDNYGRVTKYQVIIQTIINNSDQPMTRFPNLLPKAEASKASLNYFLAIELTRDDMSFRLQFEPGVSMVAALKNHIETPGNYFIHFRAAAEDNSRGNTMVYGNLAYYKLERRFLKKLPEPKNEETGSYSVKISINATIDSLPKGFVPVFFYVIAVKILPGQILKDPKEYKQEDLKKYNPLSKDAPYIAAVLTRTQLQNMPYFVLGDGKTTKKPIRRRRLARAAAEEYVNNALDPNGNYSVFVRAVDSKASYYSTPWTTPVKTKAAPSEEDEDTGTNPGPIIGAVVAVSLVLFIVAAAFMVYMKRKRNHNQGGSKNIDGISNLDVQELKSYDDSIDNKDGVDESTSQLASAIVDGPLQKPTSLEVKRNPSYPPFSAKDIVQYFNNQHAENDAGFTDEFSQLPKGQLFTWQVGKQANNKLKNRFANIIAYDYNRVKLRFFEDGSDYINASDIVDYFGKRRYIACQAPVLKTVNDFWTLAWEQNISAIVMLTKCVEGTKKKSEEYWPTSGTEHYGPISVSYLGAEEFPEYNISTFELKKGNVTRTCRHFHFTTWPDHGAPEYPTALLSFRRRFRSLFPWDKQGDKPILVHCSAGVGRTGTFIAVDTLITLIQKSRIIDVFGYVQLLRTQRPEMVQRQCQYQFIYECLLEAAICGVTEFTVQEYRGRCNNLSIVDSKTKIDGFRREFTSLSMVTIGIPEEEFSSGTQPFNKRKNRNQKVLPKNTQRVFLPAVTNEDGCNYINAVYVDGSTRDQFIATQSPLANTIGDFWRMVLDLKSATIVSLTSSNEAFPEYFPNEGEIEYGNGQIKVEMISYEQLDPGVIRRSFVVLDKQFSSKSREIHHYHITDWVDHKSPKNATSLVKLMGEVETTQRTLSDGPIVVHCSDGTGRTGTFISAYLVLERLKSQQMIDVFQSVRRIRKTRTQFVENVEQYKLLYDIVGVYLEQFSTYSNF